MKLESRFAASCKGRLQKQRQLKGLYHAGSNPTRTLAAICAAGLVIASAGFGAVYAWTSGAAHGPLMASLTVLMAVALEGCKPLAVAAAFTAFRSWAPMRGAALSLLAFVAIAYSLTAELTLMATARSDLVAERVAAAKTAKSADGKRERIEAELVKLPSARPVETVRSEIIGHLADPRVGDCNTIDGPRSRAICPTVNMLRVELGNAQRREKLETELAALQTNRQTTDKKADPGAHALSVYLAALGLTVASGLLSDWLTLIPVLALEIGAALAVLLVQAVSSGHGTPRQVEQKLDIHAQAQPGQPESMRLDTESRSGAGEAVSSAPMPPAPKRTRRKPTKRTPGRGGGGGNGEQRKPRLGNVIHLLKERGGRIEGGQRSIARSLGVSKSRANQMLHELAAAGSVRLATSRAGTTVALAA